MWVFLAFVCVSAAAVNGESCKGCLNLDATSLAKIVPRFKHTLIKYDIAYPYGSKHEAFLQFADELSAVGDVIVAEIGVKDYGEKENEELAKSHGVDTKSLPAIKLFHGSIDAVHSYEEADVSVDKLRNFIRTHSDIHITLPGCVEALDLFAEEFVKATTKNDRLAIISKVKVMESETGAATKETVNVYQMYMKKLMDDEEFVGKEQKRLRKILADGKLSDAKKTTLQEKINILEAFSSVQKGGTQPKTDL